MRAWTESKHRAGRDVRRRAGCIVVDIALPSGRRREDNGTERRGWKRF